MKYDYNTSYPTSSKSAEGKPTTEQTTEETSQPTEETAQTTEETAQTTEATETTEAMSITLTINMDENNELIETINYYEYETNFLRRMVAKALKAEAEAKSEVRKLKKITLQTPCNRHCMAT